MFPSDTPHADIVKLIKEAIILISDETTPKGGVRAVTLFHNGGLMVEMESDSLATWLRKSINRTALTNKLGPTVSFRSSALPVVIEYLPIRTQITDEDFIRATEKENNLPENSLISAR